MSAQSYALSFVALCLTACASAQTHAGTVTMQCPAEVEGIFASIVGDWTLGVEADEGWSGYGSSNIAWNQNQKCGVVETSIMVFDPDGEDASENRATAYLVYDELSETIKILTADNRGYVHIGIAAAKAPLAFEILKPADEVPNRRIQYRSVESGAFEWSWQGRETQSDDWTDRLVIKYQSAP